MELRVKGRAMGISSRLSSSESRSASAVQRQGTSPLGLLYFMRSHRESPAFLFYFTDLAFSPSPETLS